MPTLLRASALLSFSILLCSCGGAPNDPVPTSHKAQRADTGASTTASYTNVLQKIYIAYFGRPADPGGLAYFAARLQELGAPTTLQGLASSYFSDPVVHALIDSFGTSQESRDLYPGTNEDFIRAVYRNLLNRDADAPGLAYWAGLINAGYLSRGNAAMSIMAGAQGSDLTIIDNKIKVATDFTNSLASPAELAAYSGLTANAFVRRVVSSVELGTDPNAFKQSVTATITTLVAGIPPPTNTPLVWEQTANWDYADWQ